MRGRSLVLIGFVIIVGWLRPAHCAPETDWWRTDGAAVVEYGNAVGGTVCSLFLYNGNEAAVVTWGKTSAKGISFYDDSWRFQPNQPVSVAVRVGATWLGDSSGRGAPNLMAVADQRQLSVPISQTMEDLLQNAAHITMLSGSIEISIDVDQQKMPALLRAVERCRAALK